MAIPDIDLDDKSISRPEGIVVKRIDVVRFLHGWNLAKDWHQEEL